MAAVDLRRGDRDADLVSLARLLDRFKDRPDRRDQRFGGKKEQANTGNSKSRASSVTS